MYTDEKIHSEIFLSRDFYSTKQVYHHYYGSDTVYCSTTDTAQGALTFCLEFNKGIRKKKQFPCAMHPAQRHKYESIALYSKIAGTSTSFFLPFNCHFSCMCLAFYEDL